MTVFPELGVGPWALFPVPGLFTPVWEDGVGKEGRFAFLGVLMTIRLEKLELNH